MDAVAFIVPVLNRPWRVEPLVRSIEDATPEPHRIVFVADEGDHAELEAIEAAGKAVLVVEPGTRYGRKINLGYRATTEPFIFTGADDLNPHFGWFTSALAHMRDGIGVVGTVDLCNDRTRTGQTSTHSLVRRSYIEERSGVADAADQVYCELYTHEYVDDELVRTAMKRHAYAHAFDSVVEHLHPNVGKAPMDLTYELGRQRTLQNRRLFMSRRRLWS